MKQILFEGACTALVTPFGADGSIDFERFDRLLERQIAAGVPAVVVAGTTGEAATLTREEKLALFARAVKTAGGRLRIIAGTGSNDTARAAALSREARACGVDGLLCVTPYYNKCTPEGLRRHYLTIAETAQLPLILYNVPSRTAVRLLPETCAALARHPLIAGLKEAEADMGRLGKLCTLCGADFPIYCGCDEAIVPFCSLGARGVVSVWSNVCPEAAVRLCALCKDSQFGEAAALQLQHQPLIEALFAEVNPIPVKEALRLLGFDCGVCRLPLTPCSAQASRRLALLLAGSEAGRALNT